MQGRASGNPRPVHPAKVTVDSSRRSTVGVWESLGNQTLRTRRICRHRLDSPPPLNSQNATHTISVEWLQQIPKPCAKVRILPGAPDSEGASRKDETDSGARSPDTPEPRRRHIWTDGIAAPDTGEVEGATGATGNAGAGGFGGAHGVALTPAQARTTGDPSQLPGGQGTLRERCMVLAIAPARRVPSPPFASICNSHIWLLTLHGGVVARR